MTTPTSAPIMGIDFAVDVRGTPGFIVGYSGQNAIRQLSWLWARELAAAYGVLPRRSQLLAEREQT